LVGIFGIVNFWRELSFDNLVGTPFLNNLAGTPFYLKRGAGCIKKGANAPLLGGAPLNFQYKNIPTKFSFGICMVNTGKIPTNTNQKYQIGIKLI
jgi:hypothetical protein